MNRKTGATLALRAWQMRRNGEVMTAKGVGRQLSSRLVRVRDRGGALRWTTQQVRGRLKGVLPGARIFRRALLGLFAAIAVVASLQPLGTSASGYTADAGERLVPMAWSRVNPGPHTIDVMVVLDASWSRDFERGHLTGDPQYGAELVIEAASARLEPAGIKLNLVGVERWEAPASARSTHDQLQAIEAGFEPPPNGIVVGFFGAAAGGEVDGTAQRHGRSLVLRHHPGNSEHDAFVLTHELGHILGLHHHDCPDGACFMVSHGYDPNRHWCDEHFALLRMNGGYFRYLQDRA